MSNLFYAPHQEFEKTASVDEFSKVAQVLVSGDPDALSSIMSDEDRAFFHLQPNTVEKLASGFPLSANDVQRLGDNEVAALEILGGDAMDKVAAYVEFYDQVATNERVGRAQAQIYWAQEKMAQVQAEEDQVEKLAEALADPEKCARLLKQARAEMQRRGQRG